MKIKIKRDEPPCVGQTTTHPKAPPTAHTRNDFDSRPRERFFLIIYRCIICQFCPRRYTTQKESMAFLCHVSCRLHVDRFLRAVVCVCVPDTIQNSRNSLKYLVSRESSLNKEKGSHPLQTPDGRESGRRRCI